MAYSIPNQARRQNFKDDVEGRVNRILRACEQIGECANPNKYDYTMADIAAVESAIIDAVDEMKSRFVHSKKTSFSFGEKQ